IVAVGADVEHTSACQSAAAVGDDPAGVRVEVTMRPPRSVDLAIQQQQASTVLVCTGIECRGTSADSRVRGGDLPGTAEQLAAVGHVKGVYPMVVATGAVPAHCNYVQRTMRTGTTIDDGRRGDADLRADLITAAIVAGGLAGDVHRYLP